MGVARGDPLPFEFRCSTRTGSTSRSSWRARCTGSQCSERTGIRRFYNGPESHPDNQFILGSPPDVAGSSSAPGSTRSASRRPEAPAGPGRVGRRGRAAGGPRAGGPPAVRALPREHAVAARARLRGAGSALRGAVAQPRARVGAAVPGARRSTTARRWPAPGSSKMGWSEPLRRTGAGAPEERAATYGWGRQAWRDWVDEEQRATRQGVALYDQTSFGKLRVHGRRSGPAVPRLHRRRRPAGRLGRLHRGAEPPRRLRGRRHCDRVSDDEWLLLTNAASPVRDADWLRRHVQPGWRVSVVDVTTAYAVLGLMGPSSRELLGRITSTDLRTDAFPFATSSVLDLGPARVRATRMTYVGELGWSCSCRPSCRRCLGPARGGGQRPRPRLAGYYAINALRLDKGYRVRPRARPRPATRSRPV